MAGRRRYFMFALVAAVAASGVRSETTHRAAEQRKSSGTTEPAGRDRPPMPEVSRPVMFNTPEADRILAALQVYPQDNPWNEDISKRPLHRNSKNLVTSVGREKNLAYNLDMAFILVPPSQTRVSVKLIFPGWASDFDCAPTSTSLVSRHTRKPSSRRSRSTACSSRITAATGASQSPPTAGSKTSTSCDGSKEATSKSSSPRDRGLAVDERSNATHPTDLRPYPRCTTATLSTQSP
jgi:hypothetical protein